MKNKLKLFYISIITVLLYCIVYLTNQMDKIDVRFIEQNEVANKHMSRSHSFYLNVLKKNVTLKQENDKLKKALTEK